MYKFKTDDGEIVEVDFEQMMDARDGILTLDDGRIARRIDRPTATKTTEPVVGVSPELVSENLGFTKLQLNEMIEHKKMHPELTGVEFKPDPTEPSFYRVHFSDHKQRDMYIRRRQFRDQNSRNGSGGLTEEMLKKSSELVLRVHGGENNPKSID